MAVASILQDFRKTQPVGDAVAPDVFVRMQLDLEKSISSLVSFCRTIPTGLVLHANLSASQVTAYFDTTGLGVIGKPYEGWAICNGSNGTPSLDGRFVRSETSAAGATGGTDSSAHTHAIDHDHASFTSGSHTLTTAEIPAHAHTLARIVPSFIGGGGGAYNISEAGTDWKDLTATDNAGGGGGHTHAVDVPAITATSGATSASDNRPAYYELVPVMRL